MIERIGTPERLLAYVVRAQLDPAATMFVTPPDVSLQLGLVVHAAGGEVLRHVHRPLGRRLVGTNEVLLVRRGRCEVDLYDDDRALVATLELRKGDVILLAGGGHGFRFEEDTVLLEVKQGPYTGVDEKERF
jgi:hypothetical protein